MNVFLILFLGDAALFMLVTLLAVVLSAATVTVYRLQCYTHRMISGLVDSS